MPAKVMCDFRLFGIPYQGLLYCENLSQEHFYWLKNDGNLNIIHCLDDDPMDDKTERYEHQEIFQLAATGFYGPLEKTDIDRNLYLYGTEDFDEENDPCVNVDIENGSLVGFALIDHR